ncbi:MAG: hypothetical protein ACERJ1_08400 [Halodesulfovibrio sp.]|uniref:hypothetical protein n=1 Tax=Halodesulfovibrio sp. TaxID=1912772 RepID=UPI00359DADD7
MIKAKFRGEMVSVEEFLSKATPRYKERGIYAKCPMCHEKVFVRGGSSPSSPSCFFHQKKDVSSSSLDDCSLAERGDNRLHSLKPDEWDFGQVDSLYKKFDCIENRRSTYNFMEACCGSNGFDKESFMRCLARANKRNIWAYKGIKLWMVPYILLTLENFTNKKGYSFHFVIQKPSLLWSKPELCSLGKVFSSNGDMMNTLFRYTQDGAEKAFSNPLSFSKEHFQLLSGTAINK